MGWLFQKILKGIGICMAAMAVDVMLRKDYFFAAMVTALLVLTVVILYFRDLKQSPIVSKKRANK